ncbi:hypothetical protein [Methylobacterium sp. 10]|nr:hypothetical protein [Methylobacterium sp. 10]
MTTSSAPALAPYDTDVIVVVAGPVGPKTGCALHPSADAGDP